MIKILPVQGQLLVIREVRHHAPVWPVFWYEVYDIPPPGSKLPHAIWNVQFQEPDVKSIDFFECSENFFRNDLGIHDSSVNQLRFKRRPPPTDISIWAVNTGTIASDGLNSVILRRLKPSAHMTEESADNSLGTSTFSYNFDPFRVRFPGDRPVAISGGARRGLWFLPPRNKGKDCAYDSSRKRVGEIVRYLATEMDPEQVTSKQLEKEIVKITLPPPLLKELKSGMTAHAFDESIGRLVLSTHDSSLIHILDFSDHM